MSTYGEAQRLAKRRMLALLASVVGVTILAVCVLGFAFSRASKRLTVDPSVVLAGPDYTPPAREPRQARLGTGSEGLHSPDAMLRRELSKLRYDDERTVRRFLERHHVIAQEHSAIEAARFADRLLKIATESAASEARSDVAVRRSVVAVFIRYPRDLLRGDPFGSYLVAPDAELRRLAVIGAARHAAERHAGAIVALAKDPVPDVRESVAEALTGRRDEEALDALLTLLRDEDDAVIAAAGVALGTSLGKPLPPAFLDACRAERGNVRMAVAEALGVVRGAEAAPILAGMTRDTDWRVRQRALRGLGRLRGRHAPIAVRALEDVAVDRELPRTDRLAALQALAPMPELARPDEVQRIAISDPDPVLRLFAARAMLTHGELAAVAPLLELLHVEMGEHCDEEDRDFIRTTSNATLREALDIEGATDAHYVEQAAKRKVLLIDRESFSYSPVHVYEFW